jgi:hypothetical protein
MTDEQNPAGWPGAPGVPENPKRGNTWHWLQHGNGEIVPRWWSCSYWQAVGGQGANIYPHEAAKAWPRYLGPCLTPAEVAARVAAARADGMRAGVREARSILQHATGRWPHVGPVPPGIRGEWALRDRVLSLLDDADTPGWLGNPTHWQPLPPPPAQEGGEDG